MTGIGIKLKKLTYKKKIYLFGIISFFAFALFFGISAVFAYYHNSTPLSILAGLIGDFDSGNGDVNMMIYKETGYNTNVFVRSYSIPAVGYMFDKTKTICNKPCDDDETKNCEISCGTDSSTDLSCYYNYNENSNSFELTSSHKLTCKFYFKAESESDINVYIMIESDNGEYSLIENIPAFGYIYKNAVCDNGSVVTFDANTKKFNVQAQIKDTCYAYFDKTASADIIVNVYVQSEDGSTVYEPVYTIPANKIFEKSTEKASSCVDANGNVTNAAIDYVNGYVTVSASGKQICDVYLDLVEEE